MAQRTVRFYQVVNENRERFPNQLPFADLMQAVRDLPDDDAYVNLDSFEVLGSARTADGRGAKPEADLLMLDRITRDVRLRIERHRQSRPLLLEDDETLAEPTFYALFDQNVLAVMRNSGSSPSPSSFRDYVNGLDILSDRIQIAPLVDRDALRALREVDEVRKMIFAVGPDVALDHMPANSKIRRVKRFIEEEIGHVGVELTLRVAPATSSEALDAIYQELEDASRLENIESFNKLEMGYKKLADGRAAAFDFISEAIVTQADVDLVPETAQPTDLSAAQEMWSAYEGVLEDLRVALARVE